MKTESQFAHSEGITSVTRSEHADLQKKIITCGSDGEIRIWEKTEGFDEGEIFSASDNCIGITCHNDRVYVGTENNTVEMYELPKGTSLGVKARFGAAVNHVHVSNDGKLLAAGSSDTFIQIVNLEDSGVMPRKIEAHSARVLSVSIDPLKQVVVSTGCDGTVIVWSLAETGPRQLMKWDKVFKASNDISTSSTLCRVSWSPNGKQLAILYQVPAEFISSHDKSDQVVLYDREDWKEIRSFRSKTADVLSVTQFSSCGKYLAAGGSDGAVLVWNVETCENVMQLVKSGDHITGLVFSQNNDEIFFTDMKGRLHSVKEFEGGNKASASSKQESSASNKDEDNNVDKEFEGLDGMFDDNMDEDDDNDNEISIIKIKADVGYINDEYVGLAKAKQETKDDDDAASVSSLKSEQTTKPVQQTVINPFTDPQRAFQPSSTPVHLEHRFMVWNNIGIIRNYSMNEEELDAIDIEFHDTATHHPIHMRNQFDFTVATMSTNAVVFGSQAARDQPSKLHCILLNAWDSSKEWTIDIPENEDVTCVAVGSCWIVASTSLNQLRLFSLGGIQHFIYQLPGTIVAISGFEEFIFVTYHYGVGISGNQSIYYTILKVKGSRLTTVVSDSPLPLTPKSTMTWIGFTDEGTPSFSDSKDNLFILNGQLWTCFCDMKVLLHAPNDHFWVVGVSETAQNMRAVKCKGVRYPPTLPRPTLMIIDSKIPLCELSNEKGQLEDEFLRSCLLKSVAKKMERKGYDSEEFKDKADKDLQSALLKVFMICCKSNRDFRAAEYAKLMPTAHAVQVLVKCAIRSSKRSLSDRVLRVGRKKLDEEDGNNNDDDTTDDWETASRVTNIIYSGRRGRSTSDLLSDNNTSTVYSQDMFSEYDRTPASSSRRDFQTPTTTTTPITTVKLTENPLLAKQKNEIRSILTPTSATSAKRNPFKKPDTPSSSLTNPTSPLAESQLSDGEGDSSGIAFIDAWKKPTDKSTTQEFNPKGRGKKKDTDKVTGNRGKGRGKNVVSSSGSTKKQVSLFDMKKGGAIKAKSTSSELEINASSTASFDENSSSSIDDSPLPQQEENSTNITEDLNENGDNSINSMEVEQIQPEKKRKRDANDEDGEVEQRKARIAAHLSSFVSSNGNE